MKQRYALYVSLYSYDENPEEKQFYLGNNDRST